LGPLLVWLAFEFLFGIDLFISDANTIIFIMLTTFYYMGLLMFTFINWIDFYFDVTIVTDRRIVDIDQIGLVKRTYTETNLKDVKETHVEQRGFFANIFDYGTVFIQVPATRQSLIINKVSRPRDVARVINDLHNQVITRRVTRTVSASEAATREYGSMHIEHPEDIVSDTPDTGTNTPEDPTPPASQPPPSPQ